jgi:hypothetical protein
MSDDLVKQLRCYADLNDAIFNPWVYGEAADRIEKLEAANLKQSLITVDHLSRIEKLETALKHCIIERDEWLDEARKALEGKDD